MSAIIKIEEQKKQVDFFKTLATSMFKSGQYKDMNESTILNIIMTANDLGISPSKAVNGGFYIVNGKISMSTALMADRIRKAGHSIRIPEWTSEKCVIMGIRKDNGDSVKFEFTIQDANAAGLTNSPTWKKWPKQMLYNRAMSTLARTLFPDVVGNAYSEDEKHDIQGTPPSQRPDEDPDTITIEPAQIEEKKYISREKCEELIELMAVLHPARINEITAQIFQWLNISDIEKIPEERADKIMNWIKDGAKISKKETE